jgi:chorismate synthase
MNSFGRLFRLSIFGESHGTGVGILVDGCPAGLPLNEGDFLTDLERRKPAAKGTTARLEPDQPEILSGIYDGRTTGAPIEIFFKNINIQSGDYDTFQDIPRPGHADFTSRSKFGGYNDHRGSGHFSGRLTLGLVAAGVIAKKIICPVVIQAKLVEAGGDTNIERAVDRAVKEGNSVGGMILCRIEPVPVGLGEPFFDSLESLIAHLVFSIPAVKGIEFGAGFEAARMSGKDYNDLILSADGKTETNHAGGINGGISNGNLIIFRVAVKPASSISIPQFTYNFKSGRREHLIIKGRHDACIALRMPVIIEAAAALVMSDLMLMEQKIPRIIS